MTLSIPMISPPAYKMLLTPRSVSPAQIFPRASNLVAQVPAGCLHLILPQAWQQPPRSSPKISTSWHSCPWVISSSWMWARPSDSLLAAKGWQKCWDVTCDIKLQKDLDSILLALSCSPVCSCWWKPAAVFWAALWRGPVARNWETPTTSEDLRPSVQQSWMNPLLLTTTGKSGSLPRRTQPQPMTWLLLQETWSPKHTTEPCPQRPAETEIINVWCLQPLNFELIHSIEIDNWCISKLPKPVPSPKLYFSCQCIHVTAMYPLTYAYNGLARHPSFAFFASTKAQMFCIFQSQLIGLSKLKICLLCVPFGNHAICAT